MTTVEPASERPRPKAPMPPLDARAPRPAVARLRKGVVTGLVMSGAGLVAGALAWAFVVQPELRARAQDAKVAARSAEARGAVRPSEVVTDAPATYAQLNRLPEPRRLGGEGAPVGRTDTPEPPIRRAPPPRTVDSSADARASGLFFAVSSVSAAPAPAAAPRREPARFDVTGAHGAVYSPHTLLPPLSPYEVKAGAIIPAALLTAVDTARNGPVVAVVTEPVFDTVAGRHVMIPQGTRLIGRHEGESRHGDRRAFIAWERLILPNGKSLVLAREPGIDAQGAIGIEGRVDRRLVPLAVATLFAGAITTLGQVARDGDRGGSGGLLGDAGDAAAIEASQVGGRLIDRELEVGPRSACGQAPGSGCW